MKNVSVIKISGEKAYQHIGGGAYEKVTPAFHDMQEALEAFLEKNGGRIDFNSRGQYEDLQENYLKKVDKWGKRAVGTSIGAAPICAAFPAFAAGGTVNGVNLMEKLQPIIDMIQELALPVGIIYASWGLIEIILGNIPSGKQKLIYSIVGYIGIFIIPLIFIAIHGAFKGVI